MDHSGDFINTQVTIVDAKGIVKRSSYIGLVPSTRSSREKSYSCGITYRSKSLFRSYLIEAAWITAKKDTVLRKYYQWRKGHLKGPAVEKLHYR